MDFYIDRSMEQPHVPEFAVRSAFDRRGGTDRRRAPAGTPVPETAEDRRARLLSRRMLPDRRAGN